MMLVLSARANELDVAVSLRGSPEAMVRQNQVAQNSGYTFAETPEDIRRLVEAGEFVRLEGNADYEVLGRMAYPYARPEVRLFIERLSQQYRAGTGEKLVVTSLVRAISEQPRNAHRLSVHPAGISIDLRVSQRPASRQWLETVLLRLEAQGVLDVIRERYPPHYHVALFPERYLAHVTALIGEDAEALAMGVVVPPETDAAPLLVDQEEAIVRIEATALGDAGSGPSRVLAALSALVLILALLGLTKTQRVFTRTGG